MQENFDLVQGWVATHEGGYVNHPRDPGGATNKGVTKRVYDAYRVLNNQPTRSVRKITDHEALDIYRTQYWDAVQGDLLPSGLDYCVYDYGVNSGPNRSAKVLQRLIGVPDDGQIGNVTLARIAEIERAGGIGDLIKDICTQRWEWMKTLRTFSTFGRGWTRRVMGEEIGVQDGDTGVIDRAYKLSINAPTTAPTAVAPGKALDEDANVTSRVRGGLNLDTLGKVGAGGIAPAVLAASESEGPMAYAMSGVVVIAAVLAAIVVYRVFVKGGSK